MGTRAYVRVAGAILTAFLIGSNAAAAEVIRIGGTGAATEMLRHIGAAFTAATETKVEVLASLGSTGAIRAAADGVLDIAVSGRPLTSAEKAEGLIAVAAARGPFVLVTSHRKPDALKAAQIPKIFGAANATWWDGTPIRIILRPRSESDTTLIGELFPGMRAAIESARQRHDLPVGGTDQDNAELAERVPGSLAGATLTQVRMEKRDLRLIALDGVEPTLEAFEKGAYPYGKTLYFVSSPKSSGAERFIAFLRTPQGQQLLRETGNLPVIKQ